MRSCGTSRSRASADRPRTARALLPTAQPDAAQPPAPGAAQPRPAEPAYVDDDAGRSARPEGAAGGATAAATAARQRRPASAVRRLARGLEPPRGARDRAAPRRPPQPLCRAARVERER